MWYLDRMRENLTESDVRRLKEIHAPVTVGVSPDDARRGLCVMPDGELRFYGIEGKTHCWKADGHTVYLSSRNGLDWTRCEGPAGSAPANSGGALQTGTIAMSAAARVPWSGWYVTVVTRSGGDEKGTWAELSEIGPGDTSPRMVKICDEICECLFQPVALTTGHRLLVTTNTSRNGDYHPCVLITDDDGETWKIVPLKSTPKHEAVFPHRGVRWQNNGCEPNLAEMPDGRLMLLMRNSLDFFYVYWSADRGDTWTDGEPSRFHGTLTTPFLLRLSDGRVVCFWNNTRPLAEQDHERSWPPVSSGAVSGRWEDVFTNRDANHAAVTSDGVHWTGFREIALDEIRNCSDFRVRGGSATSADKSVHQFQALELPFGRILVAYGQNAVSRRMAVFDVEWLYEKERTEDLSLGLEHLTTHLYVKSLSESHVAQGFNGHCAWNRTDGALLVPDPDCTGGEALQIARVHDERLFSERQGVVWNFPAADAGELKLQLRIEGSGVRVRLCDHWMNACDEYAGLYAAYDFELDDRVLDRGVWQEVSVVFGGGTAAVSAGEKLLFTVRTRNPAPDGVSYLHLQTMAEESDFRGTLIRKMEFRAK